MPLEDYMFMYDWYMYESELQKQSNKQNKSGKGKARNAKSETWDME